LWDHCFILMSLLKEQRYKVHVNKKLTAAIICVKS
jgi:hypothetical protein